MSDIKYTLWTIPRSEWTELPDFEMTPELIEKIRTVLAEPMSDEFKERFRPYQNNSYFG